MNPVYSRPDGLALQDGQLRKDLVHPKNRERGTKKSQQGTGPIHFCAVFCAKYANLVQAFAHFNSPYKKHGGRHRTFVVYGRAARMPGSRRPSAPEKHPMYRGSIPERSRDVG
jgi:hypothetical protein